MTIVNIANKVRLRTQATTAFHRAEKEDIREAVKLPLRVSVEIKVLM